jgi:hypothetical protein
MDDGELRPLGVPVFQPVVDALPGMGRGRVGVPAGWLVDDQQIVVFINDAGPPAEPGCRARR